MLQTIIVQKKIMLEATFVYKKGVQKTIAQNMVVLEKATT